MISRAFLRGGIGLFNGIMDLVSVSARGVRRFARFHILLSVVVYWLPWEIWVRFGIFGVTLSHISQFGDLVRIIQPQLIAATSLTSSSCESRVAVHQERSIGRMMPCSQLG